jgi:diguanylate cyclase (GGDEF)-like protein
MRQIIVKLGRTKTTIIITILSIFLSVCITLLALYALGLLAVNLNIFAGLLIAISAPLIVAPSISWIIIGLIFEIHELEEDMRLLATYDSLTGLLSRRAFLEQTNYVCRFAERQGLEFTILVIDLDHFKKINDQYGHAAGDRVLESFGEITRQISRESDLPGRIGGEEFALFLSVTTIENACSFAERLHKAIRETAIEWNGASIRYTISIGLAFCSQTVNNIDKVLSLADKALYHAKMKGRNQTVVYNADLENQSPVNSAAVHSNLV